MRYRSKPTYMKNLLLAFVLFYAPFHFAQNSEYKSVYFDSDIHSLRDVEKTALKQFVGRLNLVQKITLEGHADSSGYKKLNQDLSYNRALSVRNLLVELGIPDSIIVYRYFGDQQPKLSNKSVNGRQENRRVDICALLKVQEIKKEVPVLPEKDCSDTTIVFPQGTEVVINRCIYEKIKDQFKLTEYNTGTSLRNSNLTTMTTDGQPLISGGMFKLEIPDSTPVVVLIPRQEICGEYPDLKLWKEQHNQWENMVEKLEIVEIEDQQYFKVTMIQSAVINCDQLYEAAGQRQDFLYNPFASTDVKVVLRNGLKIDSAKLSWDSPPTVLIGRKKRFRKNVAVFSAGCPCSVSLIAVTATDRKGKTYIMDYTSTEYIDKREVFGRCKSEQISKRFLFFKIKEKSIYRKYIVRKKDFKKVV